MMTDKTLESISLWYKYKTAVWLKESAETTVVHNIMRVLRAIHGSSDLAYASIPVTSGRFLYELKQRKPLVLANIQIEEAIKHNYSFGWKFVEDIRARRTCPVIFPADLIPVHQKWEQVHFQSLWLSIIAEKCTEVHMAHGWEYSNGASEEFTHVMQLKLGLPKHNNLVFWNTKELIEVECERMRNILVYDDTGRVLSLSRGCKLIEKSLAWIKKNNFSAPVIKNCLDLLRLTENMLTQNFYQQ